MTRSLVVASLALLGGCSPEPHEMRWFVELPEDVPASTVIAVGVRVVQGACPVDCIEDHAARRQEDPQKYAASFYVGPDGELEPPSGGFRGTTLPNGTYCFFAQARRADCALLASGCQQVDLPSDVTVSMRAFPVMDPTHPEICGCPADRCLGDGTCFGEGGGECPCDAPATEDDCHDGLDEDCDGRADCFDPDCPVPPSESDCTAGFDEDCDTLVDAADPDCATAPGGPADPMDPMSPFTPGSICMDPERCEPPTCHTTASGCAPVSEAQACSDGFDNNRDGPTDCADPTCTGSPCLFDRDRGEWGSCKVCEGAGVCVRNRELFCGDGMDNDCDGRGDCTDTDCENRLCGLSYSNWLVGADWGNSRCCNYECVSFGDAAVISCGTCGVRCEGSCVRIENHTGVTHTDSYTCSCANDSDCPSPHDDPTGEGRRGWVCEDGECHCRYDFACGPNAVCSVGGTHRHCHPKNLNLRP